MALSDAVPFATAAYALSDLTDSVGGLTLTNTGSVAFSAGKFGNAADFGTGTTGKKLGHADASAYSSGNVKFMIRAWVKFSALTKNYPGILGKADSGASSDYWLIYRGSGTDAFEFVYGNGAPTVRYASFTPVIGTWYLIHAWHDPDNDLIGMDVNANGAATTSLIGGNTSTGRNFSIGNIGDYSDGHSQWDGMIDDVVILNGYLLDATERAADYAAGAGAPFSSWSGGGGGTSLPVLLHSHREQGIAA
jgi:hypothetical protein